MPPDPKHAEDSAHSSDPAGLPFDDLTTLWSAFLRRNDVVAVQRLYEALRPEVLRYCRSILGDAHLAEDVFHTAFARLLERRPDVRTDVKSMLLTMARNLCRDELGGRERRSGLSTKLRLVASSVEDDPVEKDEELTALGECLAELSEREYRFLMLTTGEGCSHREAAEILKWPAPDHTLTRTLKSIKDKLLRCLKKKGISSANSR